MRQTSRFVLLAVTCVVLSSTLGAGNSGSDLISRYREETSEVAKRDLALKMIDTGVLKLFATTKKDVAAIFGGDWTPDVKAEQYQSYGIVHFAKQPTGPEDVQVPFVGWYLVIHYNTKDQVVVAWELSNVHK